MTAPTYLDAKDDEELQPSSVYTLEACVAVCCSVMQCVAVYCSVSKYVAV